MRVGYDKLTAACESDRRFKATDWRDASIIIQARLGREGRGMDWKGGVVGW